MRLVVAFPPGGAADLLARLIGQSLSETLGQPVVIENKGGANGNIGGEVVARSAPDGYTLLMSSGSMVAINPHIYANMPFDPARISFPSPPSRETRLSGLASGKSGTGFQGVHR